MAKNTSSPGVFQWRSRRKAIKFNIVKEIRDKIDSFVDPEFCTSHDSSQNQTDFVNLENCFAERAAENNQYLQNDLAGNFTTDREVNYTDFRNALDHDYFDVDQDNYYNDNDSTEYQLRRDARRTTRYSNNCENRHYTYCVGDWGILYNGTDNNSNCSTANSPVRTEDNSSVQSSNYASELGTDNSTVNNSEGCTTHYDSDGCTIVYANDFTSFNNELEKTTNANKEV